MRPQLLIGATLSLIVVAPILWAAMKIRARLFTQTTWASARLTEAVLVLATILAIAQALGALGMFRPILLVATCASIGLLAVVVVDRSGRVPLERKLPVVGQRLGMLERATLTVALGVTVASWSLGTATALEGGILSYDSLWYHLPHAARFAQTGWLTRLHFTFPEFPDALHPSNAEVIHAIGMMLFRSDALSPLINLGWLALALLAAWCIGERANAAPATFIACALVLTTPIMAGDSGQALNDTAALFFLLALVALAPAWGHHETAGWAPASAVAAIAGGCALSTKLYVVAPTLVMAIAGLLVARPARRRTQLVLWLLPLSLTGSYWYIRNLVRTGSPLSSVHLGIGPLAFPDGKFELVERYGYSVADYLLDAGIWRRFFIPALDAALGPTWWLTVSLGAVGLVLALGRRPRAAITIGASALAALVVYAIMPTTASGREGYPIPLRREPQIRLAGATPCSRLPSDMAAPSPQRLVSRQPRGDGRNHRRAAARRVFSLVFVDQLAPRRGRGITRPPCHRNRHVRWPTSNPDMGTRALGRYPHRRLCARRLPAHGALCDGTLRSLPVAAWAETVRGSRLGVTSQQQHQLYDRNLMNRVEFIGSPGPHGAFRWIADCETWRERVREGRYDYLVLQRPRFDPLTSKAVSPEVGWTTSDPAARLIADDLKLPAGEAVWVFKLDPRAPVRACR